MNPIRAVLISLALFGVLATALVAIPLPPNSEPDVADVVVAHSNLDARLPDRTARISRSARSVSDEKVFRAEQLAHRRAGNILSVRAYEQTKEHEAQVAAAEAERQRLAAEAAARAARTQAPRTTAAASGPVVTGDVWWRLALCESGGRNVNTGNGYYGYFQFLPSTWRSVGGPGMPHEHSYETQKHYAQVLQSRYGWGQWPSCSRQLGLR